MVARLPRSPAQGDRPAAPGERAAAPRAASPRRRALALVVPLAVIALVFTGFYALQEATFRATALTPAAFAQLSTGMDRGQVATVVSAKGLDAPTTIISQGPVLPGASCRYYAARSGPLDLGNDMFRLCFTGS